MSVLPSVCPQPSCRCRASPLSPLHGFSQLLQPVFPMAARAPFQQDPDSSSDLHGPRPCPEPSGTPLSAGGSWSPTPSLSGESEDKGVMGRGQGPSQEQPSVLS